MIHMKSDESKSLFEIGQIIGIKVQMVFQQCSAEIKQTWDFFLIWSGDLK